MKKITFSFIKLKKKKNTIIDDANKSRGKDPREKSPCYSFYKLRTQTKRLILL